MSVLFVAPLPEPVTGDAVACQAFLDVLRTEQRVEVIDLNKNDLRSGVTSLGRIVDVLRIVVRVWRGRNDCGAIYLTISQSVAGNLKDLLIYLACFARLSRMAIHLHGGAGMARIMSAEHPLLRRLNDFFLRRMGAVIVLGQRQAGIFSAAGPGRVHIVPNFAAEELFTSDAQIDSKFSSVRPLRILFLSNLLPGKGHEELLTAFLQLPATARNAVEIDFAGRCESDGQRDAFVERIREFPQLRYHGPVVGESKKRLFAQAHVFCLPTYYAYEGQPITILEAYAAGCAVITTDHAGIYDIFADEVNGYAVAARSAAALSSGLERALADPQRLRSMAHDNLATARDRYRSSTFARRLVSIVTELQRRAP